MKKIYILTFSDSPNYGALLQAYSLKRYISTLGNNSIVINYANPKRRYCQIHGFRKVCSVLWNKTLGLVFTDKERKNRTLKFKLEYLEFTQKCFKNVKQLIELNNEADAFIVGSDQVWSVNNNNNDPAFLLSFARKKKISYAASCGTNIIKEEYFLQNEMLFKQFDAVSVRESEGAESLKRILNIDSEILVDPVFLTSKLEWIKLLRLNSEKPKDYVLCYVMPGNNAVEQKIYDVAEKIAQARGVKILTIGKKTYSKTIGGEVLVNGCGPIEFLEMVLNAQCVVTNSFHGTAFSIIFNKEFYTVMNDSLKVNRNTRMENILSLFDLQQRGVYTSSKALDTATIDYNHINVLIEKEKNRSKCFLQNAIGE